MVALSVWLAAAFTGSRRLPENLKLGIRGVPEAIDDGLGLTEALRKVLRKERSKARDAVQGLPTSSEEKKEAAAIRKYGASEEELLAKISALAEVPAGSSVDELMARVRTKLDLAPKTPMDIVVAKETDKVWGDPMSWVWTRTPIFANQFVRLFPCHN